MYFSKQVIVISKRKNELGGHLDFIAENELYLQVQK